MKLEVGMYVRTKWGIARLTGECWEDFGGDLAYAVDCCLQPIDETKIFKEDIIGEPSFNPIDLIEAGDYVNGNKVININGNLFVNDDSFKPELQNVNIKSIVTKEMFSNVEYRVETN